jgi:hypothetical protein
LIWFLKQHIQTVSVGFNDANLFQYRLALKGRTWVFGVYYFTLSKLALTLRGEITLYRTKRSIEEAISRCVLMMLFSKY